MAGQLFVVATPIGNLGDITGRALETLRNVDLIVAEDTRHSRKLLDRYEIKTRMVSLHQHSHAPRLNEVISALEEGNNVALISDAGTPGIADPGGELVEMAAERGITVTPIPGPSSPAALLSVAGWPVEHYIFVGFLPKKKGRQTLRRKLGAAAKELGWPLVYFESPERILRTLGELTDDFGEEAGVVVGRELTKQFEEIWRGTLAGAITHFTRPGGAHPKGEFVFAVWLEDK